MKSTAKILTAILAFLFLWGGSASAQLCGPGTPVFNVDLTGVPDSTWISSDTARADTCCGATNPDRCVEFIVTLDPLAQGIIMDIPEGAGCGAKPPGALFYQINCGPPVAIGTPVCLSGVGPHYVTFCKPGNNGNCYSITSVPAPGVSPAQTVSEACSGQMWATGYEPSSIQWMSVPNNPLYDTYMDCNTCDTVNLSATPGFPDSVNYEVCGIPLGGCTTDTICDTVTVYFVTDLAVNIQPDSATVCAGFATTWIYAVPQGGAAPYSYQWTDGGGTPLGTSDSLQVAAGTYIVYATDTTNCTQVSDTIIVTEFLSNIAVNAGNDTIICVQDTAQLNAVFVEAGGIQWTTGGGTFIPGPTDPNALYIPSPAEQLAGFVDLAVITTGNGTCPGDSDTVRIFISPKPAPVITGPDPVCEWTSGHVYSTPNVAGNTYAWVVTGGAVTAGAGTNSITVDWGTSGAGSVTVTEANPIGCDSTVTVSIIINPNPDPVLSGPDSVCEWTTGHIYSTPAVAGDTYAWTVTGGTITAGTGTNSITVDWGAAGTGTVSLMQSNPAGCDTTVAVNVIISPRPDPVISGPDPVCEWTTGHVYSTPNVAGNTYAWVVTGGTISAGAGTNSITVDWGATGSGTVQVTESNGFGCDTTVAITVTINPRPDPVISGPDPVCEFTTGHVYSTPLVAGNSYAWVVTGGTVTAGAGTNSITVDWGATGAGTVQVTESNPFGCDTTVSIPIVINPKPDPLISGPLAVCEFTGGHVYSTPNVAGNTYAWTVTGGTVTAGAGTNSITVDWGATGSGTVQVTESNPFGCDTTVAVTVTINPKPDPVISGPLAVCEFTGGHVYSTPLVAGNSYAWVVTGGTVTAGAGTNSITVDWGVTGSGTVQVTESNGFGCDTTVAITVTINPKPDPVISGPLAVCELTGGHVYSTPNVAGNTYAWTVTGGTITGGAGTNSITVNWGLAGSGTVQVTESNGFGCDTTVAITVTINPKPTPVISGPLAVCEFTGGHVYSTPNVAGNTYAWTVTGGAITAGAGTNSITVDWGATGSGTVQVTESNGFGCDSTVSVTLTINPKPDPVISGPLAVCELTGGHVYSTPNVAGNTYAWTVTGGTITGGAGTNSITVNWGLAGSGTVQLTESNPFGCDTTVAITVTINPKPTPVISGPLAVCEFTGGHVYSTPLVAGNTYSWTVTGGTITGGAGTNSITVDWGVTGSGTVQVTEGNGFGCDSTVSVTVTINPKPDPVISGPLAVCELTGGHVYSTPLVAGNTYAWTVTGGTITGGAGTNSITVNWGLAGSGTVQVTESNGFGCDTTVAITVTINPKPTPVISGPLAVCEFTGGHVYSTPLVAGNTYSWTVTGGTISGGAGTNSITVDWGVTGSGTVQVTEGNGFGCDSTVAITVTINPKPDPVISGPLAVCEFTGGHVYSTPNVAGNTYAWTVTGGSITGGAGTNSITVDWGATGSGTVQVTESNPFGCDTTVAVTVTINPKPDPVISGPLAVCELTGGHVYSTPNVAGNTYAWTVTGGTITGGAGTNSITVSWGLAGSGTVQLTESNPFGCDTTVAITVTINPKPTPVISGPLAVCEFTGGHVYSTPLVAGNTYSWTVTGGTITGGAGTNSITVDWGVTGSGTVQVTEGNGFGCDSTVSVTVTINPKPDPVISGPLAVCELTGGHVYSTPLVAGNTYAWTVTGGTITGGAGTNSITVNWGLAGSGTVQVTESNGFGCDTTVAITVTINPKPTPVISGPLAVCEFTGGHVYSTPLVAGNTYSWTVTGGTITGGAGTNSITVNWGVTGSGTVQVTEGNGFGCDSTVAITVTINPKPDPVISGPLAVCEFTGGHVYSTPNVAGNTYAWTVTGGTVTAGAGTNSITVDWGATGSGTVQVTESNPFGCDTTVAVTVTINPKPDPVISGPLAVCELTGGHVYSTPNVAGNTYAWTVTGGTITGGAGTNSITVNWGLAGSGTVQLTESNPFGCDTTVAITVTINPKPTPVISGPLAVCEFTGGHVYSTPLVAGNTYSWTVTGGTITGGAGTNSITVDWGVTGLGIVQVTEGNGFGCDSTVSVTVTINPKPDPVISGPLAVCELTGGHVYSTPLVAGNTYAWTVTGGSIASGAGTNSITVNWGASGSGTVQVTESNGFGCDTTVAITVTIDPKPTPVISGPVTVCEFTGGHVYSTPFTAGNSYSWTVTGGTISGGAGTNSITVDWGVTGSGTVQVTETNAAGCDSTVSITVTINPKPNPVISGPAAVCEFSGGHVYSTPLVAGDTYSWTVTGGSITAGAGTNSITVDWGAAGAGTVTLTQTNGFGCDTTIVYNVVIDVKPDPVITGPDPVCEFTGGHVYSTPLNAGATYSWTIGGGTITAGAGTNSITVDWGAAGVGTLSVTETYPGNCDTTVTINVTINPKPNPVISGPITVCEFTGGHVYSTPLVAGDTYTWTVTGGAITGGAGTNSITVDWGATGSGTVQLTQANPFGCDTTVAITVTINPKPAPVISGPATVCEYTGGHVYSTPNNAGSTYSWTISGGNITAGAGTNSITVFWNGSGSGTLTVTETNGFGCDTTVTYTITINDKPEPVISGPAAVCEFTGGHVYSTPFVAGDTYSWTISGGTITAGAGTNSITVDWGAAGAGSLSVTQTNGAGCDTTVTYNITINPKPNPVIAGPNPVCEYTGGHVYSTPNNAGATYSWTISGGNITAGAGTNSITVFWNGSGTGTLTVTETNSFGCDTTVTLNVTINDKPEPVISGPATVCEFTGGHVYSTPLVAGDTYSWTISGGTVTAGAGTNSITVDWGAAGSGTLTVTQTTPAGCDTTVTYTVTINDKPEPVISGPTTVCEFTGGHVYSTPLVAGDTYSWTISGGTITAGAGTNSITVDWGAAGAGTLSVTQTNGFGCDTTVTYNITINPKPAPVISGPATVCEYTGGHVYSTPNNAGSTYSWTISGGNITAGAGTNSITVYWNTMGTGTLTVTETNNFGCDTTVTYSITINDKPEPVISGPTTACEFTGGHVYSTPFVAGDTYSWTINGGSITAGAGTNSITVDWGAAGAGSLTVTQTNGFGCDTTVTYNITINPKPNPVIAGPNPVCEYTGGHVYSTPNNAGSTYSWSITGGSITAGAGTNSVTVFWSTAGAGSISVTETNNFGCDTTYTLNVTINDKPEPVISGPDPVCEYTGGHVYSTPNNAGSTYSWTISGGNITAGAGTNAVTVFWNGSGTGTLTVTETNNVGCDTTVTLNITINDKPEPVISGPATVCELSGPHVYSTPFVAGDTYSWTISGGVITAGAGTNSITVNWGAAGAGSLTVTQTNSVGCDTTVTYNITIDPKPVPVINGPTTVCEYTGPHVYSVTAIPGGTYSWSVTGGNIQGSTSNSSINVNWWGTGAGTVTITLTNNLGCDSTVTVPVTINPKPDPIITGPDTVCAYSQGVVYSTPNVAGNTYNWVVTNGTLVSGQGTSSIVVNFGSNGNAEVEVTETNAFGCDTTVTFDIKVLPAPLPEINGPLEVCENLGTTVYTTNGQTGNTYTWSVTGGVLLSGQGSTSIDVFWPSSGTGTVTLYEVSPSGCDTSISVTVDILPRPEAVFEPIYESFCVPQTISFDGTMSVGETSYYWTFGPAGTSTLGRPNITFTAPGTYNVTLIVSNDVGCTDTAYGEIYAKPPPVADFSIIYPGFDPALLLGVDSLILDNNSIGGNYYWWDFGDGNNSTSFEPSHWYSEVGDYWVTLGVTDSLGCTDTMRLPINVFLDIRLLVPTGFTPNGDGINDEFWVGHMNIKTFNIMIFDRWGMLLFESDNKNFRWDGTFKNMDLPEGVYTWVIKGSNVMDETFTKAGTVTLLR